VESLEPSSPPPIWAAERELMAILPVLCARS
jgi:hypothetical protein